MPQRSMSQIFQNKLTNSHTQKREMTNFPYANVKNIFEKHYN